MYRIPVVLGLLQITNLALQYPQMSMAVVPIPPAPAAAVPGAKQAIDGKPVNGRLPIAEPVLRAGPWRHGDPPRDLPEWVVRRGFKGTLVQTTGSTTDDDRWRTA